MGLDQLYLVGQEAEVGGQDGRGDTRGHFAPILTLGPNPDVEGARRTSRRCRAGAATDDGPTDPRRARGWSRAPHLPSARATPEGRRRSRPGETCRPSTGASPPGGRGPRLRTGPPPAR